MDPFNELPRLNVRVYPDCHQPHVLQIYAGLYDLEAQRHIKLELTTHMMSHVREFTENTLWMEFDHPTEDRVVSLCFDMLDGGSLASRKGLELCDVYFKRSYSQQVVDGLPPVFAARVAPYGMNYPCLANSQRFPGKHVFAGLAIAIRGQPTSWGVGSGAYKHALQLNLAHKLLRGTRGCPFLRARDLEVPPNSSAQPTILFQTRVWKTMHETNEKRASLVQSLRREFGKRYVGGLEDTPLARRDFPDLITPMSRRKRDYVRMMQRNLVTVTTTGLYGSTGWKLPEYFAASRCIVSTPLCYQLPVPLRSGTHYLAAQSTDEFIDACSRILTDTSLANALREAAWAYYLSNIEPSSLVRRCLLAALTLSNPTLDEPG